MEKKPKTEGLIKFQIRSTNDKLNKVIKKYFLHHYNEPFNIIQNQIIIHNIRESKFMIINNCIDQQKNIYFIIGFKNTLMIINLSLIQNLKPLFSYNKELKI